MCEANAYLLKDGQEEMVFENVDRLQFQEGDCCWKTFSDGV